MWATCRILLHVLGQELAKPVYRGSKKVRNAILPHRVVDIVVNASAGIPEAATDPRFVPFVYSDPGLRAPRQVMHHALPSPASFSRGLIGP